MATATTAPIPATDPESVQTFLEYRAAMQYMGEKMDRARKDTTRQAWRDKMDTLFTAKQAQVKAVWELILDYTDTDDEYVWVVNQPM